MIFRQIEIGSKHRYLGCSWCLHRLMHAAEATSSHFSHDENEIGRSKGVMNQMKMREMINSNPAKTTGNVCCIKRSQSHLPSKANFANWQLQNRRARSSFNAFNPNPTMFFAPFRVCWLGFKPPLRGTTPEAVIDVECVCVCVGWRGAAVRLKSEGYLQWHADMPEIATI